MLLTKLTIAVAVVLALGAFGTGTSRLLHSRVVAKAPAAVEPVSPAAADKPVLPAETEKFLGCSKFTSVAMPPEEPVAVAEASDPLKRKGSLATQKPAAGVTPDEDGVVQAINRFRWTKKVEPLEVDPKLMEAARDAARSSAEGKNALVSQELGYPRVTVHPLTPNGGTAADMPRFVKENANRLQNFGNTLANPKMQGIGVGFATLKNGATICMLFIGGDK